MSTPLWALLGSAIWLKLRRRRWWSVQEPAEHWCRWKLVGHRRSTICHTVRISCRYCRCPFWSFCATEPELKLPARQHLEDSQGFSSPQMISSTFELQESPYFRQEHFVCSEQEITLFRVIPTMGFQGILHSDIYICRWDLALCPLRSGARGRGSAVPNDIWRSRLRSGSARCDLALAVEVRLCPLRSGPVPTEIWSSRSAHWDPALAPSWRKQLW